MVLKQFKQVIRLISNERRVLLETRLRNLRRRYVHLLQHADLMEEARETKREISEIETELAMT